MGGTCGRLLTLLRSSFTSRSNPCPVSVKMLASGTADIGIFALVLSFALISPINPGSVALIFHGPFSPRPSKARPRRRALGHRVQSPRFTDEKSFRPKMIHRIKDHSCVYDFCDFFLPVILSFFSSFPLFLVDRRVHQAIRSHGKSVCRSTRIMQRGGTD